MELVAHIIYLWASDMIDRFVASYWPQKTAPPADNQV